MTARTETNYAWLWFFGFIVVASVGVAWFMIEFNRRLQLRPEQLAEAQALWKERGPSDYRMTYTKRIGDRDHMDTFVVTVRNRRAVEVLMNGEPLRNEETNEPFPPGDDRLQYHTMDRLMRDIERFLELDAKAGKKNYNVALFNDETGALQRYVRRVMGTRERVEEDVKVDPLAP
jgi:hypothetical protein